MRVYGLFGKSGTGKSHKSSEAAAHFDIEAIIDDGLLIMNQMRVAGTTAKNERTMHASTKRAIFLSDEHRREVGAYIANANISTILVIGTSQKMIRTIADRLGLPAEIEWIPIEQFQTEDELRLAKERRSRGFHVIPIRSIEVEKVYNGKWFRRLVVMWGKHKKEVTLIKRTYLRGKITIDPRCIHDLIRIAAIPTIHIHAVKLEHQKATIKLGMREGQSVRELEDWRSRVTSVLNTALGIPYTVEIEWDSIFEEKF